MKRERLRIHRSEEEPIEEHRSVFPRSTGQALEPATKGFLEARFGHSLANIRIHADAQADQLAQSTDAAALTVGQDVFFRQGRYEPGSDKGMSLLTHEVAHTVQNRELPMDWGDRKLALTQPGDVVERGAMKAANQVVAGSVVPSIPALSGPMVARLTDAESLDISGRSNSTEPTSDVKTPSLSSPAQPTATTSTIWQNRLFSARIEGSEDDRRIDFMLDREGGKITGSFAIHDTGHGNITKGEFDPKDTASPLRLECAFTDRELKGQTRVLDG